jgi:exopolysaccharide production protein ExoQ
MKFKYLIVLVIFIIGIPNYFIKYDVTALTSYQGIDINKIFRVLLYSLLLYFTIILTLNKQLLYKKYLATVKVPFIYYSLYGFLFIFGNHIGILESYYRVFEWFGLLMLIYYIQLLQDEFFTIYDFIKLIKILVWYSIFLIFIGLIIRKDMVFIASETFGFFRLGGYVIGPNTLGVIAGLGISYYLFIDKGKKLKKIFALGILFLVMFFTYSRGALLGFIISLIPLLFIKNKFRKGFIIFLLITIGFSILKFDTIINYLSRGEGIENLLTLSERYYVFIASVELIKQNFLTGFGFVTGTEIIGDLMQELSDIKYWKNIHAHNEFLQAFSSGGIFMFLFDVYIFYRIFLKITKIKNNGVKIFLFSVYLQLLIFSFLMVTISFPVSILNALIWLLYISKINLEDRYAKNFH